MNFTPEKRREADLFLQELLANGGLVAHACKRARLERRTVYNWRKADIGFATQWDEVIDLCVEAAELECRRRAIEGVDEPVYHKGELIDTVRKFSDVLLIFFLKAHRPEKYRERIQIDVNAVDAEIERRLAELAAGSQTASTGETESEAIN
jgi:hypothetical protein